MAVSVSVVITCYNYGSYLTGAVQSVLAQTYRDFEIIIVNDGSTDNTDEVMAPFLGNPKVRYICRENGGQARAKNAGIMNAAGKFIAFLDADDFWMPQKLEKQIKLFDDESVGVVYSGIKKIDENGRDVAGFLQPKMYKGKIVKDLLFANFICFSSSIIRKSVLEKTGYFNEDIEMGIDWDLWLRISPKYQFDFVDDELVAYRAGHANQMSRNIEKRMWCQDVIKNDFFRLFPEYEPLRKRVMVKSRISRAIYFLEVDPGRSRQLLKEAVRTDPWALGLFKRFLRAKAAQIFKSVMPEKFRMYSGKI